MAKDPIFPLYYNDIDRSTKTWTDEEFGAYMRLLMEQWDKGSLPNDYQRLTRIATSLDKNWTMLKEKFVEVDGRLQNRHLEEIREKRAKHRQKQTDNVMKRYQKSTKTPTKNLPLENEIENENENEDVFKGGVGEKFTDTWFADIFDSMFMDQTGMTFRHLDLANELAIFKLKVRGSPPDYQSRDAGGIRQAFIYQLKNSKQSKNGSGEKQDRHTKHTISLMEDYQQRHAGLFNSGEV